MHTPTLVKRRIGRRALLRAALGASTGVVGLMVLSSAGATSVAAQDRYLTPLPGGPTIGAVPAPLDFIAWHDRTIADHQQMVDSYASQGYRTISVSIYGDRSDPRYAAIMVRRTTLIAQQQFWALTAAEWQQTFDDMASQGWGPTIVSATGPAQDPLIAAVFRQMAQIPLTRHGLTADELRQLNQQAWAQGLIPQWVDAYGDTGDTRFIAVWRPNADLAAWNFDSVAEDPVITQERFDALASVWARPAHLAISPSQGFIEVFADNVNGPWVSRTGMTSAEYQSQFNALVAQGFTPLRVAGEGSGNQARFAAIFATREDTEPRVFRTSGSAGVSAIDDAVMGVMKANQVRGAALAIVDGTRLVYAKGYTWAESSYPTVQPTTMFRQASVSKTFTALAIYQLIHEGKLTLDTPVQSVLHLKTPTLAEPVDPRFGQITIRHLLEMTGGVDAALIWRDVVTAQAFGSSLPVSPSQLSSYCASQPLSGTPGDPTIATYSNGGYFLLGQVVAALRGSTSFADAIAASLLKPLQITRVRPARTLVADQLADEARYHPRPLATATSVVSSDQPMVGLGYGETNMSNCAGAGGLSAAVTDVARLLAALSLRTANPILDDATMSAALANAAAASANAQLKQRAHGFHGFDWVGAVDVAAGTYRGYKGGSLSTSQNGFYFERGGLSYVICWNSLTPTGEAWYPAFQSVLAEAAKATWGEVDLFPQFGMPSFPSTASGSRLSAARYQSPLPSVTVSPMVHPSS